eukprot:gnl/MRDRNA2_/MRDRNA2_626844_c0_seq1.p1 gnl/MRDRNA2_/MRDRNA2_626844_c0~~gnl/MRDRNA2_/MRDRNA2_626844_c0_seq1.p1  ORF type:complete len:149 (+),score=19.58 gnl/MRDRNA2_/MRDRNA2_626844_c0_seq1:41-448(+)
MEGSNNPVFAVQRALTQCANKPYLKNKLADKLRQLKVSDDQLVNSAFDVQSDDEQLGYNMQFGFEQCSQLVEQRRFKAVPPSMPPGTFHVLSTVNASEKPLENAKPESEQLDQHTQTEHSGLSSRVPRAKKLVSL